MSGKHRGAVRPGAYRQATDRSMAVGSARRLTARITDERLGVYDYTPTNKKIHKKMVKICIVSPREENLTKNWSKSVCAYRKET